MGTLYAPRGMNATTHPKGPTKMIADCGDKRGPRKSAAAADTTPSPTQRKGSGALTEQKQLP